MGGISGSGYGAVSNGKHVSISAHVLSYELYNGPVPSSMFVCHTCDNKTCVNPTHLFLGTLQDNKDDEVAKGRHVRGERQGQSKLTEEDVKQIRLLIARGDSIGRIAKLYNMSWTAIDYIRQRRNWGWVQ